MDAALVARDYWLKPLVAEELPEIATQLLVAGYDSASLRRVAGLVASDPRDARDAFVQALQELGVWIRNREAAQLLLARDLARDLLAGHAGFAEVAATARAHCDFDEVVAGALPPALEEFVLLAWLHGDQAYDASGGDARFRQAAITLLDEVASTQEGPPQPGAP